MLDQKKAVALEYRKKAPVIMAKARGQLLEKLLEIARENGITIQKDPDLTEVLSLFETGSEIPEELFKAVSEVMAHCYRINRTFREKILSDK
jgi:flagellar biosynthesis protein